VGVSASLISQIELGKATPSVGTLYSIVSELGISMDDLFRAPGDEGPAAGGPAPVDDNPEGGQGAQKSSSPQEHPSKAAPSPDPVRQSVWRPPPHQVALTDGPLVSPHQRQSIHLSSGVTWESMNPDNRDDVDFLYVTYEVGGASAAEDQLIRHSGREYGHVLEGRLGVTVGFENYELEPGDAISFDSSVPHRLFNIGDVPVRAVWFVVGRREARVSLGVADSA
jgi:mannose-6-phosphate isomerase-like protein (cupin superfamily)